MQFNDGCGQVLYIKHSSIVKRKENIRLLLFIFWYVEVQIEQIKMVQSFIELAARGRIILETNGKNWQ